MRKFVSSLLKIFLLPRTSNGILTSIPYFSFFSFENSYAMNWIFLMKVEKIPFVDLRSIVIILNSTPRWEQAQILSAIFLASSN